MLTPASEDHMAETTAEGIKSVKPQPLRMRVKHVPPPISKEVLSPIPDSPCTENSDEPDRPQPPVTYRQRGKPVPPPLICGGASDNTVPTLRDTRPSGVHRGRWSDRVSTALVDVAQVERHLDGQELEDVQRQRLLDFVSDKKKVGELRPENFEKLNELGKGNGGVVSRVRHTATGRIMARKNIHLDIKPVVRTQIMRELHVLNDCNSPYIVGYYGAFYAEGDISVCMEYMDAGSLDLILRHAGRMPEPIVSRILYSVLKGLIYLHDHMSIIHRDVKPSNILVKRFGEVKLCDFGVSGQLIDSLANSFVGTRSYMAPERLTGENYSTLSDVWSLGLTLNELATGCYPIPAIEDEGVYLTAFSADREVNLEAHIVAASEGQVLKAVSSQKNSDPMAIFELLSCIVDQPLPRLPRFCFSDDFIDLVSKCVGRQPSDRSSLKQLLKHPFVCSIAGTLPTGANRRSSMHTSILELSADSDPDQAEIRQYLEKILPSTSNVDD